MFGSENSSFMNLTSESNCNWAFRDFDDSNPHIITVTEYINIILYPVLLFICTVGNLSSLTLMLTEKPKTTTCVFLAVVSAADLGVLWSYLYHYIPDTRYYVNNEPTDDVPYRNSGGAIQWFQVTCAQISDWALIVFGFERLIVVSSFRFRDGFRVPRTICAVLLIIFLSMVFHMENLAAYYYKLQTGIRSEDFVGPLGRWDTIQQQAEVGMVIGKWLLLTCINCYMIAFLSSSRHSALEVNKHVGRTSSNRDFRSSNNLLMASILLYFVTQAPNVIFICLSIASRPPFCTFNLTDHAQTMAIPVVNLAFLANYSLNCILYCIVTAKFRRRIMQSVKSFRKSGRWTLPTPSTNTTQLLNHRISSTPLKCGSANLAIPHSSFRLHTTSAV